MKIFLNEDQHELLYALITNDPEFIAYINRALNDVLYGYSKTAPENWGPFIKQKYKLHFRTSEDEYSPYYYGSLYGTKNRITMFLLRL